MTNTAAPRTALNSTSVERKPSSYVSSFVRGKSSYFPFRPGGLGAIELEEESKNGLDVADKLEAAFEKGMGTYQLLWS